MDIDSENLTLVAIASGGGHWVQLMRLKSFTEKFDTTYISTIKSLDDLEDIKKYFTVTDCNQNEYLKALLCSKQLLKILYKLKPRILITTGSLPGLIALLICKYMFKSKVIWIDSIANGFELSMSGRIAKKHADICLSQWEDIAKKEKIKYLGSVL